MDEPDDDRDQLDVVMGCLSVLAMIIIIAAAAAIVWGIITAVTVL